MYKKIISHQIGFDTNYKTWHINNTNMLIYIHSNGGSIVCNEKVYPIKRGALCFVGAKKYHYTVPDDTSIYDRSKVFASTEELNKIAMRLDEDSKISESFNENSFVYAEINECDRQKVEALFEEIKSYENNKKYGRAVFMLCYTRLLAYISENTIDTLSPPRSSVHKALEYINANISNELCVDGICEHVHMSKYHFCRSFKSATGLTVMEYILKTRIVMAENMLAKEEYSISEISELCGFSSVSYFCRTFKENLLMSPLQYKKSVQKAQTDTNKSTNGCFCDIAQPKGT